MIRIGATSVLLAVVWLVGCAEKKKEAVAATPTGLPDERNTSTDEEEEVSGDDGHPPVVECLEDGGCYKEKTFTFTVDAAQAGLEPTAAAVDSVRVNVSLREVTTSDPCVHVNQADLKTAPYREGKSLTVSLSADGGNTGAGSSSLLIYACDAKKIVFAVSGMETGYVYGLSASFDGRSAWLDVVSPRFSGDSSKDGEKAIDMMVNRMGKLGCGEPHPTRGCYEEGTLDFSLSTQGTPLAAANATEGQNTVLVDVKRSGAYSDAIDCLQPVATAPADKQSLTVTLTGDRIPATEDGEYVKEFEMKQVFVYTCSAGELKFGLKDLAPGLTYSLAVASAGPRGTLTANSAVFEATGARPGHYELPFANAAAGQVQ